jgi:chromodomain-helicase-DNA-binding protein 7
VQSSSESEDEMEQEEPVPVDEWRAFFNPPIDIILGFRDGRYLVKFKGRSYLHTQWLPEDEILEDGRNGKLKLNRFLRDPNRPAEDVDALIDPNYLEIDRVLHTTELFPVIHPRQAALVSDRWQGLCASLLSKIINYRRNGICYSIPFLEPVDPESTLGMHYYKQVKYPIDLCSIHSRLYTGYYTNPTEFWKDLGFLFKNTQICFSDRTTDIRIASDTLRQIAIYLYKHWYLYSREVGIDPGPYSLRWVTLVDNYDVNSPEFINMNVDITEFTQQEEDEDFNMNEQHLSQDELNEIKLSSETDKLFLVKWKNLSYTEATWEPESLINNPQKIADYYKFNKALDSQARQELTDLLNTFLKITAFTNEESTGRRSRFSNNNQNFSLLRAFDFPTHDFRNPVVQYPQSPIFKDNKQLREYQVEGLNWLLRNWGMKKNSILADEMGLGKTIQVVSFLNTLYSFYKHRGPYLVIAPLSTLSHWKKTIEDWTLMNSVMYHDPNGAEGRTICREHETYYIDIMKRGGISKRSKLVKFHVLITSYEVFMQDFHSFFKEIPFQMIAVDEAHRLKNKQAKILQYLRLLPCKRYILMTGTPLQNNTEELWSLLNFIEPSVFGSSPEFLLKYGSLSSKEQVEQLQNELQPYLLRRLKEEVEQSIPPLQETIIDVELTNIQKTYYRAIYEKNRSFLCKGSSAPALTNMELQLRKCCNHPYLIKGVEQSYTIGCLTPEEKMKKLTESSGKMVLIDKLLPRLKSQNKKVLIFSQFTQMLNILEEFLSHSGYKYERLDGSIKATDRQAAIERFNAVEHERDVFLLSTRAGGLGINLTSAQVVIIFDSDWNPQNDVQATARAHRIGQTQEVQVYRLITARTYEAEMFERASRKLGLDQALFSKEGRTEIENLLKFGAYSILDDDNSKSQHFVESNIDEILETKTRVVNYSVIRGSYTLQKSSFISQSSDMTINVDDPNFWNKILPPQTSMASRLLTKLNDKSFNIDESSTEFMQELELSVSEVMESKTSLDNKNVEEEELLTSLLIQVSQTKAFPKQHRQMAIKWMNDLSRPTRSRSKVIRSGSPDLISNSEDSDVEAGRKVTSFGGTGAICAHCEKEGVGWFCSGPCKRSWHSGCKDKELDPSHDSSLPEDEEAQALERWGWMCKNCQHMRARCFKCGARGRYKNSEDDNKNKKHQPLIKCSLTSCGKAYHLACLKSRPKKRFICPWHYCVICSTSGNSKTLLQCSRCPNAFHLRCYSRKVVRLNKKFIVCHQHKQPSEAPTYPSHKNALADVQKPLKAKLNEAGSKYSYLSNVEDKPVKEPRKKKKIVHDESKDADSS